ncbi:L-2-hydroxyglutarate oxidase [Mariniphaga anaerophila]|uniref:L-2-hydroxyglutarate oxidase n=1 Tax=Mariniphaga anaerophila TaxID=1484053 RepID=A0A1M5BKR4_9BACT|nr:L-2-hydroxyglutarate oxidase [Mariniphaga anaerophila]SHF42940.1 L-2-hydroxyglutarate oxidase [Mariniphaga anaerophila]
MIYDILIIGGGIVGLATALKLKENNQDLKIALVEKEKELATHQTGNNSGVIHAGVYYKPGSLKALNCRRGYELLTAFCNREKVKYDLCGKLIVATSEEELPRLENLWERGQQNGLTKIKKLTGEEISEYEPHAKGVAAIHVPYTGIIDYKEVCKKYAEIFQTRFGGEIFLGEKITEILPTKKGANVLTETRELTTKLIINTAGLYSDKVAKLNQPELNVRIIPFRGEYHEVKEEKRHLVKNLIYPVPDPNFPFLGVHFTRMINGGIEAGPNAVWAFQREGYKKTAFRADEFWESLAWPGFRKVMGKYWKVGLGEYYRSYNKAALVKALQKLVPEIQHDDIHPGGAGVRAQACDRSGGLIDDFLITEDKFILNVLNAPSPAATASLAIGETVAAKALKKLESFRTSKQHEFINNN